MNTLNFCLSGYILISPLGLPDVFWPPKFLMRSLLIMLLRIPCIWVPSVLLCSWFFPVCLAFENWIMMFLSVSLWVLLSWSSLSFLDVYFCFYQILVTLSYYFLSYPLFSFGNPTMHVLVFLVLSNGSLKFCSLFFSHFYFSFSDLIISIVISSRSLVLSSACSLRSSSEIFISIIVLYSSRICFWFLFRSSVPLLIFLFAHLLFSWLSPYFCLVCWSSLRQLFENLPLIYQQVFFWDDVC